MALPAGNGTAAALDHPGIVRVLHSGATADGRPWYAMEKIEGTQLDAWVREESPPLRRRLEMFVTLCGAAHHAHQRGVIHRDLKPANIMMEAASGLPKIVDFGLARFTESLMRAAPDHGRPCDGHPMFMAPEQARGESAAVGTASDTYALGAILFTLLSSTMPYDHRLPTLELLEAIRTRPPQKLRAVHPDVPRDLEASSIVPWPASLTAATAVPRRWVRMCSDSSTAIRSRPGAAPGCISSARRSGGTGRPPLRWLCCSRSQAAPGSGTCGKLHGAMKSPAKPTAKPDHCCPIC